MRQLSIPYYVYRTFLPIKKTCVTSFQVLHETLSFSFTSEGPTGVARYLVESSIGAIEPFLKEREKHV